MKAVEIAAAATLARLDEKFPDIVPWRMPTNFTWAIDFARSDWKTTRLVIAHAKFLLLEVKESRITGTKAHRYLAWAQAIAFASGTATIDDTREDNR